MLIYAPLFYLGPFSLFILLGNCVSLSPDGVPIQVCVSVSVTLPLSPSLSGPRLSYLSSSHTPWHCLFPSSSKHQPFQSWRRSPLTLHGLPVISESCPHAPGLQRNFTHLYSIATWLCSPRFVFWAPNDCSQAWVRDSGFCFLFGLNVWYFQWTFQHTNQSESTWGYILENSQCLTCNRHLTNVFLK